MLSKYVKLFTSLNRAPGPSWTEDTKRKAPHKPILLLAVMDLIQRGVITAPFIDACGDLVELNELFGLYWLRIVPLGQTSSIAFPFSRLDREPFWHLLPHPGKEITPSIITSTTSITYLRKHVLGATIDDELFLLMKSAAGRESLREALLLSCFSQMAQVLLREQSMINSEAYEYSRILEEKSHLPMVRAIVEARSYRPAARDQAFRRAVIKAYDHRCALCGVRIITPEQHTAVDAAHIVPWSKTQNDDIRNGMALCKLCHWAFDRGMMGVTDDYNVLTSRQIIADPNFPGFLLTLKGRAIIPPQDHALWPARHYLSVHRKQWRL
ncbi:HNH endonuclease [Geomonas subterranea]|uniref:HNH endonuclease n=1 Tax=Geomonas subterranea TaxID=2847989 RepID=A0ABX8LF05_9BACT|nr:HNH endonuclease [Geomonas subterranea]QXE89230.1 HNH endonuclease [Geomonas subterranea]QXM08658.1 HNH endonuclease [Geomonas subterranea]